MCSQGSVGGEGRDPPEPCVGKLTMALGKLCEQGGKNLVGTLTFWSFAVSLLERQCCSCGVQF